MAPTEFVCNDTPVRVDAPDGSSLLYALREHLGIFSAKDGCAPQGQCGCCTVLVDGEPRVACVTPLSRVSGRRVTTLEGLADDVRNERADALVASGGSQCGFCTPGIIMRFAGTRERDIDRGLAAHLCRCTGWLTIRDALAGDVVPTGRDHDAAARRAELEGGSPQSVGRAIALGGALFADDTAPRDALVAVPCPPGSRADALEAAGHRWVVGETLAAARAAAAKVQGRRTTASAGPPLLDRIPPLPEGGVALATSWVEPAYVEPDASWCEPGGEPASPLANGGAFGGKVDSLAPRAARELADRLGRVVRVVYSREDVVRLGPKRPPIAAVAHAAAGAVHITGFAAHGYPTRSWPTVDGVNVDASWTTTDLVGPGTSDRLRAVGLAEQAMLVAGALGRNVGVVVPSGARADARVEADRVVVRVAAGDPLDEIVLRSYAIGATHMALGWIRSESLHVDPATGEVHDLTIRSFGILRASDMPRVDIEIAADDAPPRARAGDAVFAAVAAAAWLALDCPTTLPAS